MSSDRSFPLLLACFLLSGFSALLYQTAWTREFAFVFGTSELAVVCVLASYMGGLALGAAVAGRLAERIRRPVLVYGLLELGVACCALAVPAAIRGLRALYVALYVGLSGAGDAPVADGGVAGTLAQLGGSFAILLVPTALMGATLPLLARHAVRREEEIGRRIGTLYAVNTAGAIAGTVCAAFVLMPALGLRATVQVGAAINLVIFALAALVARTAPPPPTGRGGAAPPPAGRRAVILPLVAVSGVTSFAYEVLWTRLLVHLLGGSVTAFATMLGSFLLGIALGSALAARLARGPEGSARGFAWTQVGIALATLGAFLLVDGLPGLAARVGAGGGGDAIANALVAAAVLLPAALCIGATFPFAVRVLAVDERSAAAASARVYAWNTAGAIAGAVATGYWLLPLLGFSGVVAVGVATNLLLAVAAARIAATGFQTLLAAAAASLALLVVAAPAEPWRLLRSSPLGGGQTAGERSYFRVGRSATVLLVDRGSEWNLSTNGLPEANIERPLPHPGRFLATRWLGLLPGLVQPDARSLLVIGLGGGVALEGVPTSVERIDVIELEPEVVAANRSIATERAVDPLSDPRVRVLLNDARSALLLSGARYDAVVSQPSHPWTSGASHLYTREFFSLVREHMAPGGVLVQWISLELVDDALLRTLVATLVDVFPSVRVYQPLPRVVFFIASDTTLERPDRVARGLAAAPAIVANRGVDLPEDLAAALVLDAEGARRFAEGAPLNTDDHNRLAARSLRLGDRALRPENARALFAPLDPLLAPQPGLDPLVLIRRLSAVSGPERAARVAGAQHDPAIRETGLGWVALGRRLAPDAVRHFDRALALDPASREARAGLAMALRAKLERGDPEALARVEGLDPPDAAVVRGWRLAADGEWSALQALDPELARLSLRDALHPEAVRLRVRWRVARGTPGQAAEAFAILDPILPLGLPSDFVLRARAADAAGRGVQLRASLSALALRLRSDPASQRAARDVLALLDDRAPGAPAMGGLRARFERVAGRSRP